MNIKICPNCGYKTAKEITVCPECSTTLVLSTKSIINTHATPAKPANKEQATNTHTTPNNPPQQAAVSVPQPQVQMPKMPQPPFSVYRSYNFGFISLIVAAIFLLCACFQEGYLNGIAACAFGILGVGLCCFSAIHQMREQNNFYQQEILKAILYADDFRKQMAPKNELNKNISQNVAQNTPQPQVPVVKKSDIQKNKELEVKDTTDTEDEKCAILIALVLVAAIIILIAFLIAINVDPRGFF
ncbi:MAG: hypothetical protein MR993_00590 [Spirochaetes bacterium]|nr:hypothetical protein [Spirochaetota bacterium]